MQNLMVKTIYPAFMGEVNRYGIGTKCTFLRLSGCNIRCYKKTKGILCDTPEALERNSGSLMSVEEIITKLDEIGNPLICLTGGEPLLQDVSTLLTELSRRSYNVVIETNGTQNISPYKHIPNVSFIVDCKLSSTGEGGKMLPVNYSIMGPTDYLKFVVDTEEDYLEMLAWINNHPEFNSNLSVGLFWGSKLGYLELMEMIHQDGLNISLNMQTHKMAVMYDANRESVQKLNIPREL